MTYTARTSFTVVIQDGTTARAVEEALSILLEYAETNLQSQIDPTCSKLAVLTDGVLTVRIDDWVNSTFKDDVFIPAVEAIGVLAAEPFEATLEDQDTRDAAKRYFSRIAGPAHLFPEFKSRQAREQLQVEDIVLPRSARGWPMEDLATRECMTIAAFPKDGHHTDAVSRVSVDLVGLDLDEARRDRIARLSVLLAREIAGDELILHPRPGYGAAERVLDEVGAMLGVVTEYDKRLGTAPIRPPEGADYEALFQVATSRIRRIHEEAVARAHALANAHGETEATTSNRGSPRG